ncbi:hypothetical protein [Streptacidiphilus fuscans]|uniref:MinD-like ATPase involved in chromosome partitioning or flagellar assembly n=1 Tax=Streptacidiphilus fuscans TaxID=2789292 RepID=A0A931FDK5_9ACTN|nr:hypothetical protein [Streptacidiphilus fuscans]MBF9066589.1 hypothetical protein [Streptacidiphilus fuscans]
MAVVAITGGPGAPGATSTALALLLNWPLAEHRKVLLLECDPDGGAVLSGALQGQVEAGGGLRNLALADRRGRLLEVLWEQCLDLSPGGTGDRLLLPGLTDPAQAPALAYTWEPLAQTCQALDAYGCDVLVDLGRSGTHGPSAVLVQQADAVVTVLRTTLRGLSATQPRIATLAADLATQGTGADALGLLLIQEGPYASAEVSRALGAPVLGVLPHAPREARVLSDGGQTSDRRFQRSELMRAARSTADELRALVARRRVRLRPGGGYAPEAATAAPPIPPVQSVVGTPMVSMPPTAAPAGARHAAPEFTAPVGEPLAAAAHVPVPPPAPQPAYRPAHGAAAAAVAAHPSGLVTPGQALRLQAVQQTFVPDLGAAGTDANSHPKPQDDDSASAPAQDWFNAPPLSVHAPRPPVPQPAVPQPFLPEGEPGTAQPHEPGEVSAHVR